MTKLIIGIKNKDISSCLSLHTKTIAKYYLEAKTKSDLISAKKFSLEHKLPLFIIGGGSNTIFMKEKIDGLVVRNVYQKKIIIKQHKNSVEILVSSGYPVPRLVKETIESGYSGFEYFAGMPGNVGGSLYMNSKWTKPLHYFGENLVTAFLLDKNGQIKKVSHEYFHFGYDYSILQKTGEIVLEAIFQLKKDDPKTLLQKAKQTIEYRKKTQPVGSYSNGCFFKNISLENKIKFKLPTTSAGYLIDKAGLKGFQIGDFCISNKHANFILNKGNGKIEDLKKLLLKVKGEVEKKFGITLDEEVILI